MQTPTETSNFASCCLLLFLLLVTPPPTHYPPTPLRKKRHLKMSGRVLLAFFGCFLCRVMPGSTWRTLTKFHLKIKLPSWLLCEFNKFAPGHAGVWMCLCGVCMCVCVGVCWGQAKRIQGEEKKMTAITEAETETGTEKNPEQEVREPGLLKKVAHRSCNMRTPKTATQSNISTFPNHLA